MHFGFTDDEMAVRDAVAALLDKGCPPGAVAEAFAAGESSGLAPLWRDLAAMGVPGLVAPESAGGSGLGWVALALVLAETGRAALPLPVMETTAVGVPALVVAGDPTGVLGPLIDGSQQLTVCTERDGSGRWVVPFSRADLFLLEDADGTALHDRSSVTIEPLTSVDRTRDLASVRTTGAGVPLVGTRSARDLAALGSAAQLVGLGREMVRMTVEYVQERKQFGVPVGSFQAVKHQLANATMQVEFAAPAVWAAAHELEGASAEGPRAVSLAKALASDAATLAARAALQCHGAMGYSIEYRLHLWMKRAWCLAAAHGSAAWHRDRIGRALGV